MRKISMVMAVAALAATVGACAHETRTVVRRETVQTETVPAAPVVIEKHTVIQPEPVAPPQRVYEEKRTTIENE